MSGAGLRILYVAPYYSEAVRRDLQLTFEYSPGGLNKIVPLASLLAADHHVTILSTGYSKRADLRIVRRRQDLLDLEGRPVPVIYPGYLAVRYLSFLEIALACGRECLRQRPEFVIFYNFRVETLLPALLAKLFGGAKIICQFEDGVHVLFPPRSIRGIAFRALYFLGKSLSDGLTLVNGAALAGFPETASVVVPFVLPDDAGAAVRPRLVRLKEAPDVKIAYSGTLDGERGADIFLEAARLLRDNPRLHFYVSGRGPLLDRVLAQAAGRGNLTYAGLLGAAEVEEHLRGMDILVNPQKLSHPFARFSFPSKVMRYILLNKPIVSTAFPDIARVAASGLFFYGHDDPSELARTLAELSESDIDIDYRALLAKFSETKTRRAVGDLLKRLRSPRV